MLEAGRQSQVKLFFFLGGGDKARSCFRWQRILKESPSLPHACPLINCNRIPIRLIKLCLMNHGNGAKL